jgi:8-oxo-dGTP pyrophosphatase MutT (NUDIX family)
MRSLNQHPIKQLHGNVYQRPTVRAIVVKDEQILLVYTQRYDDFSLPGGGIDKDESHEQALKRELREEIGATQFSILAPFGRYVEYRHDTKVAGKVWHIESYYYVCQLDAPLVAATPEDYEVRSGLEARWVAIDDAIAHNQNTIDGGTAGLSIVRELAVLQQIKQTLVNY